MTAVELKAHACMPEKIGAPALTKTELTNLLFDKIGLNKGEAKKMVDAFFNEISDALEKGEAVKLSGFGNFELRDKSERPGRNPKTGEKVIVSARRVVTFSASGKLNADIAGNRTFGKTERKANLRVVAETAPSSLFPGRP